MGPLCPWEGAGGLRVAGGTTPAHTAGWAQGNQSTCLCRGSSVKVARESRLSIHGLVLVAVWSFEKWTDDTEDRVRVTFPGFAA